MAKLRILCLIDTVGKGGGAEQLIATLVPHIRKLGAAIEVAAVHDWPVSHAPEIEASGVPIHQLRGAYSRVRPYSVLNLARLLHGNRFDIFWGHLTAGTAHARLAAALTGGKSIATLHSEGYQANPPRRLRDKLNTDYERRIFGGAHAQIAVSRAVAADFEAYFGWRNIAVAYNGVDVDRMRQLAATEPAAAARTRWRVSSDEFLIVTAARYVAKKGQKHLIEALALLRNQGERGLRLVLCGEGDSRELQQLAEQLGLGDSITIAGVIDQPELMPLIAAADAYVMPSLREPFGIAAAEAMALGTPTILTEVDGFFELVGESGTALMAPAADAAALADRILQVRHDPFAASVMGQRAAVRIATHFSLDNCARRWMEIFSAVHNGRAIPPCAA